MGDFSVGVIAGVFLMSIIVLLANPHQKGMVAVSSGQYSCELEERANKTTKWVCERVK